MFVRWVIIVFLALDIMLGVVIIARCQDTHERHTSQADVEDTMGFISVTFMSKDDRLIYWKRETKYEVKLMSGEKLISIQSYSKVSVTPVIRSSEPRI